MASLSFPHRSDGDLIDDIARAEARKRIRLSLLPPPGRGYWLRQRAAKLLRRTRSAKNLLLVLILLFAPARLAHAQAPSQPACSTNYPNLAVSAAGGGSNLCAPAATPCSALQNSAQTAMVNAQSQAVQALNAAAPGVLNQMGQMQGCLSGMFNTALSTAIFGLNPMTLIQQMACTAVQDTWSSVTSMLNQYQYAYSWPGLNLGGISVPGANLGIGATGATVSGGGLGSASVTPPQMFYAAPQAAPAPGTKTSSSSAFGSINPF